MKPNFKQTVLLFLIIVCGFGAIFGIGNFLEKNRPSLPANYLDDDLAFDGNKMRLYSLGFNGLMADWYWIQSLQYIGKKFADSNQETINISDLRSLNPKLLYSYLDTASNLDPRFLEIYSYGAVVLPAIDVNQAIKITEKGIANNPQEWRLYLQLGYIHWQNKNFQKAAEAYEKGAKIDGAPPILKIMSANMLKDGGSRETARQVYEQMFAETADKQAKESIGLKLLEIEAQDEIEAINQSLQTFKEKNGRCVNNFQEIFPLLQNITLPSKKDFKVDKSGNIYDPTNVAYLLDKQNCVIRLDESKTKLSTK